MTAEAIAERVGDVLTVLDDVDVAMAEWLRVGGPLRRLGRAPGIALTQVCSDFSALAHDLVHGRGRSALRQARAVAEGAVTLIELLRRPDLAERFLDHAVLGQRRAAALELPMRHLKGTELKAARHRREALLRDTESAEAAAVERYGPRFRHSWHPQSMRDRMADLGLGADDYAFYAVASDHVHSAAASGQALRHEGDFGEVLRTGPALSVAPLAYLYGVRFFRLAVDQCQASHPSSTGDALLAVLRRLKARWSEYRRALLDIDDQMWPDRPLLELVTYCCIGPDGQRRWFVEDILGGRAAEVDPPDRRRLEAVRQAIDEAQEDPEVRRRLADPASLNAFGLLPVPVAGAPLELPPEPDWVPASAVVLKRDGERFPLHPALRRLAGDVDRPGSDG